MFLGLCILIDGVPALVLVVASISLVGSFIVAVSGARYRTQELAESVQLFDSPRTGHSV